MASVVGVGHVGFTVFNLDKTVDFYVNKLGGKLLTTTIDEGENLGTYVLGEGNQKHAALKVAMIEIGGIEVEFLQYLDPPTNEKYHGNPSIAGSAHLALEVNDIQEMYEKLRKEGVKFHSSVNDCIRDGVLVWKWVYMRDPDGICCELVQKF